MQIFDRHKSCILLYFEPPSPSGATLQLSTDQLLLFYDQQDQSILVSGTNILKFAMQCIFTSISVGESSVIYRKRLETVISAIGGSTTY